MSLQSLRRRITVLAARVPVVSEVAEIAISFFEALPGGELVQVPDFGDCSIFSQSPEDSGTRPRHLLRTGRRPAGRRKLRAICIVIVAASSASPEGHAIEEAPTNPETAT